MSLEIANRKEEGIEILTLTGQLTFGQGDLRIRAELDRLIAAGKTRVLLNLSDLARLDSVGLCTLLFVHEALRKAGGNLAIFDVHPSHIEFLVEAELETVLEIFQTEQDAINSFFPDRESKRYDILAFVESRKQPSPPKPPRRKPLS